MNRRPEPLLHTDNIHGGDSPCGAADMAGNAWEWTHSRFESYPYQPEAGRIGKKPNIEKPRALGFSFPRREAV